MAIVCVTSWKTTKTILPLKTPVRGAAGHLSNWHLHSHLDTETLDRFSVTEGTHATILHNRLQPTIVIMWLQFTAVPPLTAITFVLLPMMTSQTSLQIHLVLLQDSPLEMFNEAATTKQNEMTHATTPEQRLMHRTLQTKDICIMRSKCCFRFLLVVQKEMRRPSRCFMHTITIQLSTTTILSISAIYGVKAISRHSQVYGATVYNSFFVSTAFRI